MPIGIAIGLVAGLILAWSGSFFGGSGTTEQAQVIDSREEISRPEPQRELIESATIEIADEEAEAAATVKTELQDTVRAASSEVKEITEPAPVAAADQTTGKLIRIQVLNGCGVKGITKRVAPGLRKLGFDVRESGNAKNYRHQTSKVYSRSGDMILAYRVADAVGIDRDLVSELIDTSLTDIDVTIVIGADHTKLNFGLDGNTGED